MIRIHSTSHDPRKCFRALAGARVAIIDLETTGVQRHDRIVAAGVLVDHDAFVLVTDVHRELSSLHVRISESDLRAALSPLTMRDDLTAVFHNAVFDVGMLHRAGTRVRCRIHDTQKLLKLHDSDRGPDGDESGPRVVRTRRGFGDPMNYKLKDVAKHTLGINAIDFPGTMVGLSLPKLCRYLKSDLIVTQALYERLQRKLSKSDWRYNERLIAPITPLLVDMTEAGVCIDTEFAQRECERLLVLMESISAQHSQRFSQNLDCGDYHLRGWVYYELGCRKIFTRQKQQSGVKDPPSGRTKKQLSLKAEHVHALWKESEGERKESLALLHDYKLVQGQMRRLAALPDYVDHSTGRIHSRFNDSQVSGRISSSKPSLQQIARKVKQGEKRECISEDFERVEIRSRDVIVASKDHWLVAFDIAQADVRVLAHIAESFPVDTAAQLGALYQRHDSRIRRLAQRHRRFQRVLRFSRDKFRYFQPQFVEKVKCPHCWTEFNNPPGSPGSLVQCPRCGCPMPIPRKRSDFVSRASCQLADDFRKGGQDFYSVATETMLGRPPQKDTNERDYMKQTILGIVNGMSCKGLAKRLDVTENEAREFIDCFASAYPKVTEFTKLMHESFAITGEASTFLGRKRRVTSHQWMTDWPSVDLFISYRDSDKLWLRVIPLRPNRHGLTCWVMKAIDAKYGSPNEGREIYNHRTGRLTKRNYRIFEDGLIFRLPVRNVSWRLIRQVRTNREHSRYEGFDRTSRSLFNHMAQGGTADIAKTMMLRAQPVCNRYKARLILQIHDELVFEVPQGTLWRFLGLMHNVLELPPTRDFRVPIVVEPKVGRRFGSMRKLETRVPFPRWKWAWFRFATWFATRDRWITSLPY